MKRLTTRARVKRIELEFRRQEEALVYCVDRIDEHLLRCCNRINQYKEAFLALVGLNERLANLGADPVELRSHVDFDSPDGLILTRVEALKVEGNILSN